MRTWGLWTLVGAIALAGCSAGVDEPTPTPSESASPESSPSPTVTLDTPEARLDALLEHTGAPEVIQVVHLPTATIIQLTDRRHFSVSEDGTFHEPPKGAREGDEDPLLEWRPFDPLAARFDEDEALAKFQELAGEEDVDDLQLTVWHHPGSRITTVSAGSRLPELQAPSLEPLPALGMEAFGDDMNQALRWIEDCSIPVSIAIGDDSVSCDDSRQLHWGDDQLPFRTVRASPHEDDPLVARVERVGNFLHGAPAAHVFGREAHPDADDVVVSIRGTDPETIIVEAEVGDETFTGQCTILGEDCSWD